MKKFTAPIAIGVVIGLLFCAAGWLTEMRAGPAPSGSDPIMASSIIFEAGSMPLALLTSDVVYRAKEASPGPIGWRLFDAGQVLLNWVLIALLLWWLIGAIRSRGHLRASEGAS